jgi:branched-chain amino acid transport system ATP-binding protein
VTGIAEPAVELDGIGLDISGVRILDGVTLSIAAGEMVGVIGPNGAGKTTLFNVVSGVVRPTRGSVRLGGRDVTRASVRQRARRGLGRTFQSSSLFDALTVQENVRLAAQVVEGAPASLVRFPRSKDAASRAALERLDEVGLAGLAQRRAGVLAHGQKRKVEIAMAAATQPSVVLLDEPMAGVASADIDGVAEVIGRLHAGGRTVLMVEHHMDVVLGLAQRVAVMHHGELLACDAPEAVMADPTVQSAYLGDPL